MISKIITIDDTRNNNDFNIYIDYISFFYVYYTLSIALI